MNNAVIHIWEDKDLHNDPHNEPFQSGRLCEKTLWEHADKSININIMSTLDKKKHDFCDLMHARIIAHHVKKILYRPIIV